MNKDNTNHFYCVILAGGIGSRLWPSSRQTKPKQFLDVLGTGETLIQSTYNRFLRFLDKSHIFVMTNAAYEDIIHEQLPELPEENHILEPMRRNTIPSATWATFHILAQDNDASIVYSPADQLIEDEEAFSKDVTDGLRYVAESHRMLSLGVEPTSADSNYGYIQMGETHNESIFEVKSFTEKPDTEFAKVLLQSGEFLWNTGLYICHGNKYIEALQENTASPYSDILKSMCNSVAKGISIDDKIESMYSQCPNNTFEQSLLEKAKHIDVQLCHFGWKDIGSWSQLYEIWKKNNEGNSLRANTMLYDCEGCIIKAPMDKLIVAQGLKDYAIIADNGVLMICKKDDQQTIRKFVNDYDIKFG